jgi:hypothetical protein
MTPSDIEKSIETWRIQFEKTQDSEYLRRFPSGSYQWGFIEERFAGFVIAMKSLVVELPRKINKPDCDYSDGYDCAIMQVTHRIKSAGINYTERE